MFVVTLKVDGGGAAVVACQEIIQDPFLPAHVILRDVMALDWPFRGKFLEVKNWSVQKSTVATYMHGTLKAAPTIREDMLTGDPKMVPHPPGTIPQQTLVTPGQEHRLPEPEDG